MNGDTETHPEVSPRDADFRLLRVAMMVVADRIAKWLTMLMAFALFAGLYWRPGPWTLGAAIGFTVLVHLPLWMRREKGVRHG